MLMFHMLNKLYNDVNDKKLFMQNNEINVEDKLALEIITDLFGDNNLSDDYINILNEYNLTKEDGNWIKERTISIASHVPKNYEDYKILLWVINDFRYFFKERYEEKHSEEINLEKLNQYKPNKLYWSIKNDQEKSEEILMPYTGDDYLNETFLKDLVEFNLLGYYEKIRNMLINTPSNELINKNIRKYCLKEFDRLNLLDEIKKEHPQSMNAAINCLIHNLNEDEINKIYELGVENYPSSVHFSLGIWIRNEFGLNLKINSKLVYDCYHSKYNEKEWKIFALSIPDTQSSIILEELCEYVCENYDEVKNINFTHKIDKRKYRLDDYDIL